MAALLFAIESPAGTSYGGGMLSRITEPELMLEREQAEAYAHADFEAPHNRVIQLFREHFPAWRGAGRVLDLGCGPGDIAIRFARAYPDCHVDGIDGAPAMLEAGRSRLAADPDIARRVHLHLALLPDQAPPHPTYDAVISNSLLHHLHQPAVAWNAMRDYARPDAPLFLVDLMRPASRAEAEDLTRQYTAGEPDVLRRDFFNSLLAAFTVAEVREQIAAAGLGHLQVEAISDRHLMAWGVR